MRYPQFEQNRIHKNLTENEVIDVLLASNKNDLQAFLSGTYYPDRKSFYDYEGFLHHKNHFEKRTKIN